MKDRPPPRRGCAEGGRAGKLAFTTARRRHGMGDGRRGPQCYQRVRLAVRQSEEQPPRGDPSLLTSTRYRAPVRSSRRRPYVQGFLSASGWLTETAFVILSGTPAAVHCSTKLVGIKLRKNAARNATGNAATHHVKYRRKGRPRVTRLRNSLRSSPCRDNVRRAATAWSQRPSGCGRSQVASSMMPIAQGTQANAAVQILTSPPAAYWSAMASHRRPS